MSANEPRSPFAGLDTALLRETKAQAERAQRQLHGKEARTPRGARTLEAANEPPTVLPFARPNERTDVQPNRRSDERTITRQSFDIYRDQYVALSQIQAARLTATGHKPKMGELVRAALDAYIRKQPDRSNERSDA